MDLTILLGTIINRLNEIGLFMDSEPIIDKEYNLISFKLARWGQWVYTVNVWTDTCAACGHSITEYELYSPDQAEESDPTPIFEARNLDELIAYLRG